MLRVAALELPARWAQPSRALADAEALLAAGPETDLALLPETSLTGYVSPEGDFDLRRFAEPQGGPTARALAALAKKHRVHLAGPLVERDGDHFFNALLLFDRDGALAGHYRKRHPWMPERWATPGADALPVFDVEGTLVTLAICFDAHFLAEESADELARADVLLFASAWVEEEDSRDDLLGGLARRFAVSVVNANWGPGVPWISGQGGSRIVDATGQVAARVPSANLRAGGNAARVDGVVGRP